MAAVGFRRAVFMQRSWELRREASANVGMLPGSIRLRLCCECAVEIDGGPNLIVEERA